jgi:hypothetical protein
LIALALIALTGAALATELVIKLTATAAVEMGLNDNRFMDLPLKQHESIRSD